MESAFTTVTKLVGELEPNDAVTGALVLSAWQEIAGEMIKGRTEPLSFTEGRLIVSVRDATWRSQLEQLAPQMLARLNARLVDGTVKFIEFRPGAPKLRAVSKKAAREDDLLPALREAAKQIGDVELRRSFIEAASSYLASKE